MWALVYKGLALPPLFSHPMMTGTKRSHSSHHSQQYQERKKHKGNRYASTSHHQQQQATEGGHDECGIFAGILFI